MKDTNIYNHVYFYINSGCKWGEGQYTKTKEAFFDEIETIFGGAGWKIIPARSSGSCPTVTNGVESLYCHPAELSGVVLPEHIPQIETLLQGAKTFTLRSSKSCGAVYDMTDEEYKEYLTENRERIEHKILEIMKTPRRNLFRPASYDVVNRIVAPFKLKRPNTLYGSSSSDIDWKYVEKLIEELAASGKLIEGTTKYGKAYRAAV